MKKEVNPLHRQYDQWIEAEEETDDDSLVMASTNMPLIKAATIERLIQRITFEKFPDPEYLSIFLLTYRSFLTPFDLLSSLIQRFNIPDPTYNSDPEFIKYFHVKKRKPIQIRFLSFFLSCYHHHPPSHHPPSHHQ